MNTKTRLMTNEKCTETQLQRPPRTDNVFVPCWKKIKAKWKEAVE